MADFDISSVPTGCRLPLCEDAPITVEIAGPERFRQLAADWTDLLARAACGNVSMHPAVAVAAADRGVEVRVLLAWRESFPGGSELVGVWVLCIGRLFRRWRSSALLSPIDRNLMLGAPVVDRRAVRRVLSAMLDALAADPVLPPILQVKEWPGQGPLQDALRQVLAERRAGVVLLKRLSRPMLSPGPSAEDYLRQTLSAKRRAELRRCRRRLAETGELRVATYRGTGETTEAFEAFLGLEASGWKGRAGTALAQQGDGALGFLRQMIRDLARDGLVTIMALHLSGRPVAMEVMLRCAGTVHTWKSAYDEALRAYGPGFVLMEDLTRALLSDDTLVMADMSNNAAFVDPHGVAAFWTERHEVVDLLIEVRRTAPLEFWAAAAACHLRRAYRAAARRRANAPRHAAAPGRIAGALRATGRGPLP